MSKYPSLSFFEHLDELRKRLVVSLAALALGTGAGWFVSDRLLYALTEPLRHSGEAVYFFAPADAFLVKLKVALLAGFLISLPVVSSQVWLFISPGLHKHEKRFLIPLALVTSGLFLTGAVFAYFVVIPAAIHFFMDMQTEVLRPLISVREYVSFLTSLILAFGVAFNLPVFLMGLVMTGVLNVQVLNHYQRHAIVLIFIAAAILTPSPDIASQLLLAGPLIVLFELSVVAALVLEKTRRKAPKSVSP